MWRADLSLAFREAVHGLDAGGPAQESCGPETTEGSLNCEETPMKNAGLEEAQARIKIAGRNINNLT